MIIHTLFQNYQNKKYGSIFYIPLNHSFIDILNSPFLITIVKTSNLYHSIAILLRINPPLKIIFKGSWNRTVFQSRWSIFPLLVEGPRGPFSSPRLTYVSLPPDYEPLQPLVGHPGCVFSLCRRDTIPKSRENASYARGWGESHPRDETTLNNPCDEYFRTSSPAFPKREGGLSFSRIMMFFNPCVRVYFPPVSVWMSNTRRRGDYFARRGSTFLDLLFLERVDEVRWLCACRYVVRSFSLLPISSSFLNLFVHLESFSGELDKVLEKIFF